MPTLLPAGHGADRLSRLHRGRWLGALCLAALYVAGM